MNISEASRVSGISAKIFRHYEVVGIVPRAVRRDSGYHDFGIADLHRHACNLGYSLERIKALLGLWSDSGRSNAEVKAVAKAHIQELEQRASRPARCVALPRPATETDDRIAQSSPA